MLHQYALSIIRKWIPNFTLKERCTIMQCLLQFSVVKFTSTFTQYINKFNRPEYWDPNILMGGLCCFYAGFLILLLSHEIKDINQSLDSLFAFTSLYMLIDHYLDNETINHDEKKLLISIIYQIFENPDKINLYIQSSPNPHGIIVAILKNIQTILNGQTNSIYYLKKLFDLEVHSTYIQRNPNNSRETYLKLSEEKGGATVQAIEAILNLPVSKEGYELGACIQLVDDIYDTHLDLKQNITTIATYDYQKNGNLDSLLLEVIQRIDGLSGKFNLFKIGLLLMLMACVSTEDSFTPETVTLFRPYSPIVKDFIFSKSFYHRLRKACF